MISQKKYPKQYITVVECLDLNNPGCGAGGTVLPLIRGLEFEILLEVSPRSPVVSDPNLIDTPDAVWRTKKRLDLISHNSYTIPTFSFW